LPLGIHGLGGGVSGFSGKKTGVIDAPTSWSRKGRKVSIDILREGEKSLSGWWLNHPSEKYARQIGNLPQIGMKIKNV